MMPKTSGNYQYLLVFADAFTGWVEAFPCRSEKTSEVIKALLKEIIPRFGLPSSIQGDKWKCLYYQRDPGSFSTSGTTKETSCFLEATIYWKNGEDEPHFKENLC